MSRTSREEKLPRFSFELSIGESVKMDRGKKVGACSSTWSKIVLLAEHCCDDALKKFLQNEFSIMNGELEVDC